MVGEEYGDVEYGGHNFLYGVKYGEAMGTFDKSRNKMYVDPRSSNIVEITIIASSRWHSRNTHLAVSACYHFWNAQSKDLEKVNGLASRI